MNEEKILIEWLLTGEEKEFITNKSRGTENRLKYGAQICYLKVKGRFIEDWAKISIKILNHLSKQLEIELVCCKLESGNKNSESRIRIETKDYLGFKEFDFKSDKLVEEVRSQKVRKFPLVV